jgi:hypothetical protein
MTRALPFSKANIRRRIEALKEAGLVVTGITADGTLLTAVDRAERDDADDPLTAVPKLRDAREKFGGSLNGPG